jgi:hypothetical protein
MPFFQNANDTALPGSTLNDIAGDQNIIAGNQNNIAGNQNNISGNQHIIAENQIIHIGDRTGMLQPTIPILFKLISLS